MYCIYHLCFLCTVLTEGSFANRTAIEKQSRVNVIQQSTLPGQSEKPQSQGFKTIVHCSKFSLPMAECSASNLGDTERK